MSKFKVGDKVKVVAIREVLDDLLVSDEVSTGDVLKVFHVHSGLLCLHSDDCKKFWFTPEMIELVDPSQPEKKFTLSDLKNGMVITYRDECRSFLFEGSLYSCGDIIKEVDRIEDYYHQDMKTKGNDSFDDIMKVEYMGETLYKRDSSQERKDEILKEIGELQKELDSLS